MRVFYGDCVCVRLCVWMHVYVSEGCVHVYVLCEHMNTHLMLYVCVSICLIMNMCVCSYMSCVWYIKRECLKMQYLSTFKMKQIFVFQFADNTMDDKMALITCGQPLQAQCKHQQHIWSQAYRIITFLKMQDPMYYETETQILINGFHAKIVYSKMLKMKNYMLNFKL